MDKVMLASFFSELEKIATSNVSLSSFSSAMTGKSAAPPQAVTMKGSMKPQTSTTNYTTVHNQSPMTAVGTAAGTKAVAPPPVRA